MRVKTSDSVSLKTFSTPFHVNGVPASNPAGAVSKSVQAADPWQCGLPSKSGSPAGSWPLMSRPPISIDCIFRISKSTGTTFSADSLDVLVPGSFDLVCARLVLFWLAGKQEIAIRRMLECLRPGGWLLDEDGDWGMVAPVDPAHSQFSLYHRVWKNGEWWTERGYDPTFGRKLPMLFERCGLVNIRHEASAAVVRGGSPWGRWWRQSLHGIRASEQADGSLTEERDKEYGTLTAPLTDPSFWFLSALIHACWGQRGVS